MERKAPALGVCGKTINTVPKVTKVPYVPFEKDGGKISPDRYARFDPNSFKILQSAINMSESDEDMGEADDDSNYREDESPEIEQVNEDEQEAGVE